ncbi:DUF2812 domain-containing protein [Clostridium botulinum]|uniref:DUF2812 domain-containing protein n=1 Tax=Clostridium botulinum TaxID=1491 RepID=UPI0006538F23|nr:DUF2812 domain-containing protein [Clostridium botulinum]KOC49942.1 hypothetical protein ADU88_04385 [Clostridium botulinum]NFO98195.1 DUF2812 domain-containing protein [Clostridium botulinum]OOV52023.1 hypothetical protein B1A66_06175 [Clostridium botulinum D/C]OOV54584.1 hypothetical protein B1A67_10435 [Clostridium botulinum D/C]OOV55141.1 hypothetical protein B0673_09005 [Clostridium botulinum D/C]
MKYKYIMIRGLASDEEQDMLKLSEYAAKGWILESISCGFFYKLRKDVPQDLIFTLDYQSNITEDYYLMLKQGGWKYVTTIGDEIHIFSAPSGTLPIYSDSETELAKYTKIKIETKKGSIYSLVIGVLMMLSLIPAVLISKTLFIAIEVLLIIDTIIFIYNLSPYLSYSDRIKQIKINGKYTGPNYKKSLKLSIFAAILSLIILLQ